MSSTDIEDRRPEISPATYDKIDRYAECLNQTPAIDKRKTFEALAADLYADALRESDLAAYQSIKDDIATLGEVYAGLNPEDVEYVMIGVEAAAKMNGNGAHKLTEEAPPPLSPDDYGSTVPATIDDTSAIVSAKFITPAAWPDEEPPPIDWLVLNRIQRGDVTTLHGDGGAGKTDIALRLAANVARGGQEWLGHEIRATDTCQVVFISAEEPERKIRRRLWHHGRHDGYRFKDIAENFCLWCPAKRSGTFMAAPDRYSGIMRPTKIMQEIAAAIADLNPALIVVDNVAATFAGNQNDRAQVRSYVNLWAEIAEGPGSPAVLLIDHPSLSGINNGTGRGGNMDWRNAVRSALWLHSPSEQVEADRGIRILETVKINDGPPGNPLRLQWSDGGLQLEHAPTSLHRVAKDHECDETFLRLLDERAGQGLDVSANPSVLYAPKVFADMPNNGGFAKRAFTDAMQRLLQSGKIIQRTDGPHSRRRSRLVRKPAA
jgi:RecA-family ATPase